jgi:hypothetical protein
MSPKRLQDDLAVSTFHSASLLLPPSKQRSVRGEPFLRNIGKWALNPCEAVAPIIEDLRRNTLLTTFVLSKVRLIPNCRVYEQGLQLRHN